ncbi:MAG: porin family protein [Dysgonamonadaceae bacterium]|jgi:hypothetical protein|nr:porin family protein [Dysgonamonadaceae bacterium]
MNKFMLPVLLLAISMGTYSQERKIKINFQYGSFKAGDYENIRPGKSYGVDISYFLSSHFFMTAHFNYGSNDYYENSWLTNIPDECIILPYRTNATLILNNVGLLGGYYLPINKWINITGQLGFSQIIKIKKAFPVKVYRPEDSEIDGRVWYDSVLFNGAFPVKFNVGITPFKELNIGFAKNIEIGYSFGFYMLPDWGFYTGAYHGPQFSIMF